MSVSSCITEAHRTHNIKKNGLRDTRDKEFRMAESDRKEKHKALEDEHKVERGRIVTWFIEQMKEEEEYFLSAIAACKAQK